MPGTELLEPVALRPPVLTEDMVFGTLNTHWGQAELGALMRPDGRPPDVLALQEVTGTEHDVVEQLGAVGLSLAGYAPELGLAVAISEKSGIQLSPGSEPRSVVMRRRGPIARSRRWLPRTDNRQQLRARGVLAVELITPEGRQLTAVTAHPAPPYKPFARRRQVMRLGEELQDAFYAGKRLLVGVDLNRVRGRGRVDERMEARAGLTRTHIQEPTWHSEGLVAKATKAIMGSPLAGFFDAILFRGKGLESVGNTRAVPVPRTDHKAVLQHFRITEETPFPQD